MKEIQGVIFDFNGTLFFDNDKHVPAWSKISQEIRGRGISEEELHEKCNGIPNKRIVEYLFGREMDAKTTEKYSELKEAYYREYCRSDQASFHLVQGAEAYFDRLKEQGIPFTIASASIKSNIDFFVESFHLDRWIDPRDIVYDDGSYVNKIAMFHKASQVIGVPLENCMIYEDSMSGIDSAYQAGCRHIVVVDSSLQASKAAVLPGVKKVIHHF